MRRRPLIFFCTPSKRVRWRSAPAKKQRIRWNSGAEAAPLRLLVRKENEAVGYESPKLRMSRDSSRGNAGFATGVYIDDVDAIAAQQLSRGRPGRPPQEKKSPHRCSR